MYSELECGVCYETYNAGRRCPRELHCKHSFCESCLLALSTEAHLGADRRIVCPLCRETTSISGERPIRAELRVDECALERMLAAGVLDQEDEEEEEEEDDDPEECAPLEREGATLPESQAGDSDAPAGSRGGRLRRSWKKVWRTISGKCLEQRPETHCMTSGDLRSLAMMSCYMF